MPKAPAPGPQGPGWQCRREVAWPCPSSSSPTQPWVCGVTVVSSAWDTNPTLSGRSPPGPVGPFLVLYKYARQHRHSERPTALTREGGSLHTRRPSLEHVKSIAVTLKSCRRAAWGSGVPQASALNAGPQQAVGCAGRGHLPRPPRHPSRQPHVQQRTECHPLGLRCRRRAAFRPPICSALLPPAGRSRHPRERLTPVGTPAAKAGLHRNGEAEDVQRLDPCTVPIETDGHASKP